MASLLHTQARQRYVNRTELVARFGFVRRDRTRQFGKEEWSTSDAKHNKTSVCAPLQGATTWRI